jgi:phytoene/squalene synthetase
VVSFLNPVLHSFGVVREYKIEHELIDAFMHSMAMDLGTVSYDPGKYHEYIYGSAEVVGLMCYGFFVTTKNFTIAQSRCPKPWLCFFQK